MKTPSWWTEERTAELKTRWAKGETGSQIFRAMGAPSRNAIVGKVYRMGLDGRINITQKNTRRSSRNAIQLRRRMNGEKGETMTVDEQPTSFANPRKLMELRDHHCRWPGTGRGIDMLYCAAPVANGYSYCTAHCRIAFQPYTPRPPKAPRL